MVQVASSRGENQNRPGLGVPGFFCLRIRLSSYIRPLVEKAVFTLAVPTSDGGGGTGYQHNADVTAE